MKDLNQFAIAKPRPVPWLAWTFLNFVGVVLVVPMVSVMAPAEPASQLSWRLPVILGIVFVAAVVFCLKARRHPIRGRTDASQLWQERFPTRTEQEIQRFLQTVGESLAYQAQDWNKLGPDEELSTLRHGWNGGDGMELVELVMVVEREYSLELPDEFLSTTKTLGELFDYVMRTAAGPSVPRSTGPKRRAE